MSTLPAEGTQATLVLDSWNALAAIRDDLRRGRRRFSHVRVAVASLSAAENIRRTAEIEAGYRACGCPEGAAGALIGVLAFGVWLVARPGGLTALAWTDALWGVFAFIVASGLGKAAGLLRARRQLRVHLAALEPALPAPELSTKTPVDDTPVCAVN